MYKLLFSLFAIFLCPDTFGQEPDSLIKAFSANIPKLVGSDGIGSLLMEYVIFPLWGFSILKEFTDIMLHHAADGEVKKKFLSFSFWVIISGALIGVWSLGEAVRDTLKSIIPKGSQISSATSQQIGENGDLGSQIYFASHGLFGAIVQKTKEAYSLKASTAGPLGAALGEAGARITGGWSVGDVCSIIATNRASMSLSKMKDEETDALARENRERDKQRAIDMKVAIADGTVKELEEKWKQETKQRRTERRSATGVIQIQRECVKKMLSGSKEAVNEMIEKAKEIQCPRQPTEDGIFGILSDMVEAVAHGWCVGKNFFIVGVLKAFGNFLSFLVDIVFALVQLTFLVTIMLTLFFAKFAFAMMPMEKHRDTGIDLMKTIASYGAFFFVFWVIQFIGAALVDLISRTISDALGPYVDDPDGLGALSLLLMRSIVLFTAAIFTVFLLIFQIPKILEIIKSGAIEKIAQLGADAMKSAMGAGAMLFSYFVPGVMTAWQYMSNKVEGNGPKKYKGRRNDDRRRWDRKENNETSGHGGGGEGEGDDTSNRKEGPYNNNGQGNGEEKDGKGGSGEYSGRNPERDKEADEMLNDIPDDKEDKDNKNSDNGEDKNKDEDEALDNRGGEIVKFGAGLLGSVLTGDMGGLERKIKDGAHRGTKETVRIAGKYTGKTARKLGGKHVAKGASWVGGKLRKGLANAEGATRKFIDHATDHPIDTAKDVFKGTIEGGKAIGKGVKTTFETVKNVPNIVLEKIEERGLLAKVEQDEKLLPEDAIWLEKRLLGRGDEYVKKLPEKVQQFIKRVTQARGEADEIIKALKEKANSKQNLTPAEMLKFKERISEIGTEFFKDAPLEVQKLIDLIPDDDEQGE